MIEPKTPKTPKPSECAFYPWKLAPQACSRAASGCILRNERASRTVIRPRRDRTPDDLCAPHHPASALSVFEEVRTLTATPSAGAALRRRLADALHDTGDIRTPAWREAVEAVPRELFVPEWFERTDTDTGTLWTPLTGEDATLEEVYADTTLVTQLDGTTRPADATGPMYGAPSSSSTLPSLVVGMLEDLRVEPDDDVLEIGTGTGYSTALLCRRLGSSKVTSIEVDPDTAHRAAAALKEAGYRPHLITGDGLDGAPDRAPFHRIIATRAVRTLPAAWLAQARTGAVILAILTGRLYAYGQARITALGSGEAVGEFLPGTISFMTARRHAAGPIDQRAALAATGDGRPTSLGPDILTDWTGRFVVQGALPTATHMTASVGDSPTLDHLIAADGSYATLLRQYDGTWRVREGGPTRLWEHAERAVAAWRNAGSPTTDRFRLRISPAAQSVHLPDTDLSWNLPAEPFAPTAG
ncbi:methyltransferase of ATP-grasp peptide maturase system [Embleya sp. AB8]